MALPPDSTTQVPGDLQSLINLIQQSPFNGMMNQQGQVRVYVYGDGEKFLDPAELVQQLSSGTLQPDISSQTGSLKGFRTGSGGGMSPQQLSEFFVRDFPLIQPLSTGNTLENTQDLQQYRPPTTGGAGYGDQDNPTLENPFYQNPDYQNFLNMLPQDIFGTGTNTGGLSDVSQFYGGGGFNPDMFAMAQAVGSPDFSISGGLPWENNDPWNPTGPNFQDPSDPSNWLDEFWDFIDDTFGPGWGSGGPIGGDSGGDSGGGGGTFRPPRGPEDTGERPNPDDPLDPRFNWPNWPDLGGGGGGGFQDFINSFLNRPSPFISPPADDPQQGQDVRNLFTNYLREVTSTLPGSLRYTDPLLGGLLGSGMGQIMDPSGFQMLQSQLLQNAYQPGLRDLINQNIGMGQGVLDPALAGLQYNLQNGLPGQQEQINSQWNTQNLFNSLAQNPSFLQQLPGLAGGQQQLIGNLTDPNLPNQGVAGPAAFLNSIFQFGPPGQQSDISGRGGLEGLQGLLTNLGGQGAQDAFGLAGQNNPLTGMGQMISQTSGQQFQNLFGGDSSPNRFLESIFQYGPPGQQSDISGRGGLEGLQGFLTNTARGATGQAFNELSGGAGGGQDLFNLAGQVNPQGGQANPIQQDSINQIYGMLQGGGLSPDFVNAQMERVLLPAQDQLLGRLNRAGGGAANLGSSGTVQDALAEQSSNFMNDLTRTGFENFSNAINQGLGAGQQTFGQGLSNSQLGLQGQQLQGNLLQGGAGLDLSRLGALQGLGGQAGGQAQGLFGQIMQNAMAPVNAATNYGAMLGGQFNQGFGNQLNQAGLLGNLSSQNAQNAMGLSGLNMQNALSPINTYSGLMNTLNQGAQGAQQAGLNSFLGLGNLGMNQFSNMGNTVLPWTQTGLSTGMGLQNQAFPQLQALQSLATGGMGSLLNQQNSLQNLLTGQQNFGLDLNRQVGSLFNTALTADLARSAQQNGNSWIGPLIGALLGAI